VAVESAALELLLNHFTWRILKLNNDDGRLLTASMMLDKKLDLLHDLVRSRMESDEKRKKLADIVSLIKEQIVNRNTIIHGFWNETGESEGEMVATKILRKSDRTISASRIRETAEKMHNLTQDFAVAVGEVAYHGDKWQLEASRQFHEASRTDYPRK